MTQTDCSRKAAPRERVDVGVKHQGHHGDGAGQGSNFGEPIILGPRPAEKRAQRALNGTRVFQHVRIDVGDDIGGHRERQQERPGEDRAAGKPAHGDEPRGAGADGEHADADTQHQCQGGSGVVGQDRPRQVAPNAVGGGDGQREDGEHGHGHQAGDGERADAPGVDREPGTQHFGKRAHRARDRRPHPIRHANGGARRAMPDVAMGCRPGGGGIVVTTLRRRNRTRPRRRVERRRRGASRPPPDLRNRP